MKLSSVIGGLALLAGCDTPDPEETIQNPRGDWACFASPDLNGEDQCAVWAGPSVPVVYAPSESEGFPDDLALVQLRSAVVTWNMALDQLGLDFRFEAPTLTDEPCMELLDLSLAGDLPPDEHRVTVCTPSLEDWERVGFAEDKYRQGNTVVNFDTLLGGYALRSPAVFLKGDYPEFDAAGQIENPDSVHALMMHELGHALGFGHSQVEAALMYPYYNPHNASIASFEEDGLVQMYGASSL